MLCGTKPFSSNATESTGMKILRATHLGMCFGVRDAIQIAVDQSRRAPVTILGDLVHNETVLADLRARGVQSAPTLNAVRTDRVMITAHGASDQLKHRLSERGLGVVEATCPLVHFAHRALKALVAEGFHPVIVGKRDHVEVRGMTEDLAAYDVILTDEDVEHLAERARFGVLAQTTQPIDRVRYLVEILRRRFPKSEVRFSDTVCQPTKQRQTAAIELAKQAEVVIVVGGNHSNNTRELVNTCATFCKRVHQVQNADDLRPEWFANAATIGLTAGTSTPDSVINAIESRLQQMACGIPYPSPLPIPESASFSAPPRPLASASEPGGMLVPFA